MAEEAGIKILWLPPYHSDLNPIERCWSFFKYELRKQQGVEKRNTAQLREFASDVLVEMGETRREDIKKSIRHAEEVSMFDCLILLQISSKITIYVQYQIIYGAFYQHKLGLFRS